MTQSYDVYVPIRGLKYSGSTIEIAPGLMINRMSKPSSLDDLKKSVSKDEWEEAISSKYWLHFDWNEEEKSTSEIMNLVLLSLWLVKPNRIEVRLKFKIGKNESEGYSCRSRILDRMQWMADEINEEFSEEDMISASSFYKSFSDIYKSRGRLSNAMILTLNGCWSNFWQAALISHAAAVESILTYSKKGGLTKRLAISYACLTEKEQSNRNEAYNDFIELYGVRSDAIHGRVHNVGRYERLPALSRFQSLLRILWHKVLTNKSTIIELEKTDEEREIFLSRIANGYSAPNNQRC